MNDASISLSPPSAEEIAAMYEGSDARLGIIAAHLVWLRIYAHRATEADWRDQMLLIQRQTDWAMEEVRKLREMNLTQGS
jgi:hypothetical protein